MCEGELAVPDIRDDDGEGRGDIFELASGRAEVSVAANIEESIDDLVPAEMRSHPSVVWLRHLRRRRYVGSTKAGRRPEWPGGREGEEIWILVGDALLPVLQARIDLLTQSLFAISRVIGVSERAISVIEQSNTSHGMLATSDWLGGAHDPAGPKLRTAVLEFLPGLLANLSETHAGRHRLAVRSFGGWVTAAEGFREVFEPAERMLSNLSGRYRRREDDYRAGAALTQLVLYLSRPPDIGSNTASTGAAITRDLLVLSPSEAFGIIALVATVEPADERERYGRDRTYIFEGIAQSLRDISRGPLVEAELAVLERNIADFDPFEDALSRPPTQLLQAAMRDHILSNGERSPWLREFLNRAGTPLGYGSKLAKGDAADPQYISALARSARNTILYALLTRNPHLGEPWDGFLDRLFQEEWLVKLRRLTKDDSNKRWEQQSFVEVGREVRNRLRADEYPLSVSVAAIARLWAPS